MVDAYIYIYMCVCVCVCMCVCKPILSNYNSFTCEAILSNYKIHLYVRLCEANGYMHIHL